MNAKGESGLLRFITAGSVDDGKSTLIGRMLFDSKSLQIDELSAIEASSKKRGMKEIDLSLITDGLLAEREQGITIDVAYRYFSTPSRKFIVGDSAGHVQYTRNMVTAASSAELVVILIDAESGVKDQTRRHLYLARWVGISHVVFAVNKMDKVNFSKKTYQDITKECFRLAVSIGYVQVNSIPVSALKGDNVTIRSEYMNWYAGPTLLEYLERLPLTNNSSALPFRFSVQRVMRLNRDNVRKNSGFEGLDLRGYQGLVVSGVINLGDEVLIGTKGHRVSVARILNASGDCVKSVSAQESVTIFLDQEVDVSRGMFFHDVTAPMTQGDNFKAELCWFDEKPLDLSRSYLMKHSCGETRIRVKSIQHRIDMETLSPIKPCLTLNMNEIGQVNIKAQNVFLFDRFKKNKSTGAFILIDEENNRTIAAGTITE